MNDINEFFGNNLGGVLRFNFIPVAHCVSIDMPIKGKVLKPVEVLTGKRWFSGYATLETIGFAEPSELTDNGTIYKPKFTAIVPKDSAEATHLFDQMSNGRFLLDYTDSNGLRKLVGSLDEPLFFSADLNTKQNIAGRNEHLINFYGTTTNKAYVYDI
jgi:hypothetical protein